MPMLFPAPTESAPNSLAVAVPQALSRAFRERYAQSTNPSVLIRAWADRGLAGYVAGAAAVVPIGSADAPQDPPREAGGGEKCRRHPRWCRARMCAVSGFQDQ